MFLKREQINPIYNKQYKTGMTHGLLIDWLYSEALNICIIGYFMALIKTIVSYEVL